MKKFIIILVVAVLVLSLSLTAFAANTAPKAVSGYGYGYCTGGYNFMWDANGDRLSRDDAEAKLDQYIKDGYILEADKDFYLEMYDYCVDKGVAYPGAGRRMGRGMGGGCCGRYRP